MVEAAAAALDIPHRDGELRQADERRLQHHQRDPDRRHREAFAQLLLHHRHLGGLAAHRNAHAQQPVFLQQRHLFQGGKPSSRIRRLREATNHQQDEAVREHQRRKDGQDTATRPAFHR